ncbi:GNAT family N-acetyltransferase [Rhizobium rhizosphaerae]|uniref:GNAT family N-acetyltransferase n=1 Tax=Xaviernesmea rhizosphaerae TaxID=1672749 RepID=A0A1Q9AM21_9HYPH|nr:GNAT family N-acetyltransferase [Xaviernesmea rhizosphaerae]OLP56460.1 GNAT family N-acetyltransferase [Xaviernesmea rhizosphaerae]
MPPGFHLTDDPDPERLRQLGSALAGFNTADVGPSGHRPLVLFLADDQGVLLAGLSGYTAWGWLYIQWLWVAETMRGQGLAGQMLEAAEAEAARRGCHGAWIDTFSPTALRTYQKAGYTAFGALDGFPQGRVRSFLQKALAPPPVSEEDGGQSHGGASKAG